MGRLLVFLSVTFLLVSAAVPAPGRAAWWDCLCFLSKRDCAAERVLPPGMHRNAYPNLKAARIGGWASARVGKKTVEGVLLDIGFRGVELGIRRDGKPERRFIPHKKIEELRVASDGESTGESFGLTPRRAVVLAARLEAKRLYLEFANTDYFEPIRETVVAEVRKLREMGGNDAREAYLRTEADKIVARVREKLGMENIGFHYNLNGGWSGDYVDRGGLVISRGDVALEHGASGDLAEKIYFFQSQKASLFDVLDARHPKILFGGRMGSVLNIFNLEHEYVRTAKAEGGITKSTDISFDFNPKWLRTREFNAAGAGLVGIPYSTYLAPPILVFDGLSKRFPGLGRLSRHEETLITLRQIEAVLLAPDRFVP